MHANIIQIASAQGTCGACVEKATTRITVNNMQEWRVCDNHFAGLIAQIHAKIAELAP